MISNFPPSAETILRSVATCMSLWRSIRDRLGVLIPSSNYDNIKYRLGRNAGEEEE